MRYRLTLAIAVLGTALVAALPAGAATNTKVSIESNAQIWGPNNEAVEVGVHYQCAGGLGTIFVQVTQSPPENAFPSLGTGTFPVTCDGQTHEAALSATSGPFAFDAGKAQATATLTAPSGTATDTRTINIVAA